MTDDDALLLTEAMEAVWYGYDTPQVIVLGERFLFRVARAQRTKRRFRRWRGKYRAAMRAARREAGR